MTTDAKTVINGENICCTDEIQPLNSDKKWTFDWILPKISFFMKGEFQIQLSNTDLLNLQNVLSSVSMWAKSDWFNVEECMYTYICLKKCVMYVHTRGHI